MPDPDVERLRKIRSFPSLVKYLRDDLDWPISSEDFDELTFDYEPEELGLDAKAAVKIKEIRQLRPLVTNQPWGIFFVNFEPKRLPVVVLRRILRSLVIKKRQSANRPQQAAWQLHDLLFISSYGEDQHRDITFAHFSEDTSQDGGLPTLRVLGWDDADTALKLDHVHLTLTEKLRWPEDESAATEWRQRWSSGFTLRHREVITTSKRLAERLAELATAIRKRVRAVLAVEIEKGPLRTMMKAFQDALIHDLTDEGFADMYAQTITYGLLSARVSRPAGLSPDDAATMVPVTNPFLRELMEEFLRIGGRRKNGDGTGIDFDELGVNEVVEVLRDANMEAVLRDFGRARPGEDPVIHFYEDFMKAYDAQQRVKRGIFYTPRPVVSFIVRSVDEILREEFGLPLGLADTTTWGEMIKRHKGLKLPAVKVRREAKTVDEPIDRNTPFVQILDPAVGTGTFLVEAIDLVHKRMHEHWLASGHVELELDNLWNEYVAEHLLPRLYGFELMMAPYAICHMKVGLKLSETGYRFRSGERLRVYLTNSLEPPQDLSEMLEFVAPFLAHEARAANTTKQNVLPSVMLGNPPYSKISSNLGEAAVSLVEPFRYLDGQRIVERGALAHELNLQDDYVKFFGLAYSMLSQVPAAVLGFISNARYLDSRSLRGMRHLLQRTFPSMRIADLGGQLAERGAAPTRDDNVFDIEQGVAIVCMSRFARRLDSSVFYCRLWGTRQAKYDHLQATTTALTCIEELNPQPPFYRLRPQAASGGETDQWPMLHELFPFNSGAIITSRDNLCIDIDPEHLLRTVRRFVNAAVGDTSLCEEIGFSIKASWDVEACRRAIQNERVNRRRLRAILYRPFDVRWVYYHTGLLDTPSRPVCDAIAEVDKPLVLLTPQIKTTAEFTHVLICRSPAEKKAASHDRATQMFPLWRLDSLANEAIANIDQGALRRLGEAGAQLTPVSLLHFVYGVLHAPGYRRLYGDAIRNSFPIIPRIDNDVLAERLSALGADLVALHLMEEDYPHALWNLPGASEANPLVTPITKFHDRGDREVRRVGEKGKVMAPSPDYGRGFGCVFINETAYFDGVPETVWDFHVGGYHVCHKWLYDRRRVGGKKPRPGRVLTDEDIDHYQKIVVALNETIRIMQEIDEVIDAHGGWPDAFVTHKAGEG